VLELLPVKVTDGDALMATVIDCVAVGVTDVDTLVLLVFVLLAVSLPDVDHDIDEVKERDNVVLALPVSLEEGELLCDSDADVVGVSLKESLVV
jgi:hypothetical protein